MSRELLQVRYKKLVEHAHAPRFGSEHAAGMDFVAIGRTYNEEFHYWEYSTGIAIEIPIGWAGLCFPRSSISNVPLILSNCVGVVDADYRGEVKARFRKWQFEGMLEDSWKVYSPGDRIFQMLLVQNPEVRLVQADELSTTARGAGGWGSTGS
jgi:dUTP pyrophosphatase